MTVKKIKVQGIFVDKKCYFQGRGRSNGDSSRTKNRPHSVHFPQQNGEQDSDKENQVAVRGARGRGAQLSSTGDSGSQV